MSKEQSFKKILEAVKSVNEKDRNYVLQTRLVDTLNWFMGVGFHPDTLNREGVSPLVVNWISPYFDQALRLDYALALEINEKILTDAAGFKIKKYSEAAMAANKEPYIHEKIELVDVLQVPFVLKCDNCGDIIPNGKQAIEHDSGFICYKCYQNFPFVKQING